jgi:hypothetical protein
MGLATFWATFSKTHLVTLQAAYDFLFLALWDRFDKAKKTG